ncbi:hypothetical protein BHE74_00027300 [Ensete ventricosum]|nr:hypothetical protein BHE74_00027300 [Ensete ventricosum]
MGCVIPGYMSWIKDCKTNGYCSYWAVRQQTATRTAHYQYRQLGLFPPRYHPKSNSNDQFRPSLAVVMR